LFIWDMFGSMIGIQLEEPNESFWESFQPPGIRAQLL
jgi:hypothetical protein